MTTRPIISVLLVGIPLPWQQAMELLLEQTTPTEVRSRRYQGASWMGLLPKQRSHRQVVVHRPVRAQLPGNAKRAPSITTRLMPWASR